jgi:hypothetical protein
MNRRPFALVVAVFVIGGLLALLWVPAFMVLAMGFDNPNRRVTKFDYEVMHLLFSYPIVFVVCFVPGLICLLRKHHVPAFWLGLVPVLFGLVLTVLVLLCLGGR